MGKHPLAKTTLKLLLMVSHEYYPRKPATYPIGRVYPLGDTGIRLLERAPIKEVAMTEVQCTIDNCGWWGQGNMCSARNIVVAAGPPESISENPGMTADMETPVDSDLKTHCHSFTMAD